MKRALDLCCKAGGATRGLQDAGYHVTGVDIKPQPHYCGDAFVQADAVTFPLNGYDFIWASPPCQGYTGMVAPGTDKAKHPRLIRLLLARLECQGTPWALENVMGAALEMGPRAITLCGSMFDLGVRHHGQFYQLQRHRLIRASYPLAPPPHRHRAPVVGIYGGHARCRAASHGGRTTRDAWEHGAIASKAMGIDWMTLDELSEAIPPAYSRWTACALIKA